jgi:hypothetical protein
MTILEFEPTEALLAICEHAIAATEPREGFRDSGHGAGLILCADSNRGVYLKSNGTPPLIDEAGDEIFVFALGADRRRDLDWAEIVCDVTGGVRGGYRYAAWPVDWARTVRYQIRQRRERIRILSTDTELAMLYETAIGGSPYARKETT